MTEPFLAWHFTAATLRDGSPIPADNVTLTHVGPLVICQSGLHASKRLIDALRYAPGATICRVEISGQVERQADKLCATERTILWRVRGDELLRLFARCCAMDVDHLWDMPAVVRQYLVTGDERLRIASATCASAAGLTYPAAADAARAALYAASSACAAAFAGYAAWSAYAAAASSPNASSAADAADAAAWAVSDANADHTAAWAQAAQNDRLTAMVEAAHKEQRT